VILPAKAKDVATDCKVWVLSLLNNANSGSTHHLAQLDLGHVLRDVRHPNAVRGVNTAHVVCQSLRLHHATVHLLVLFAQTSLNV